MIYAVIAVLILHILYLPIVISADAVLDPDSGGTIIVRLFFIPILYKRIDIDALKQKFLEKNDAMQNKDKTRSVKTKKFFIAFVKKILGYLLVRDVYIDARIGVGDAAAGAIICGSINVAIAEACLFFGTVADNCAVTPVYNAEYLFFDGGGIVCINIADIIIAASGAVRSALAERRSYAKLITE